MTYRATLRELGPTLMIGFAAFIAGVFAFAAIAEEVAEGETGLDHRFGDWLHSQANHPLTTLFKGVSMLGNGSTLGVITIVSFFILSRRRLHADAALILLAFVGGEGLSYGLKLAFQRQRPFWAATETSYSFPSAHATLSLLVYGALSLAVARRLDPAKRPALLVSTAVLICLIGFSRLYLGIHYLSDVVAGFSAGLAWLALCVVVLRLHEGRQASNELTGR